MNSLARMRAVCSRLGPTAAAAIGLWASGLVLVTSPLAASPLFFYPDTTRSYIVQSRDWYARFTHNRITFHWPRQQIALQFLGRNSHTHLRPGSPTGTVNFLRTESTRHAPVTNSLTYQSLYPGIDLLYQSSGARLKSEFHVAPGASPAEIRFTYQGATRVSLDRSGALLIIGPNGELREEAPIAYQAAPQGRITIDARYAIREDQSISIHLGPFDPTLPLIIDPVVGLSNRWGGSLLDALTGIATGPDGSLYVCGWTESANIAVTSAYQSSLRSAPDAYVMKLNPAGDTVRYATYLGGSSVDRATAIAVDSTGSAYVTGMTGSSDFPVATPYQSNLAGYQNAFLTKLSPNGSSLYFSTYLGGESADQGNAVQVDTAGNAYVAGQTRSTAFPILNAAQTRLGGLQDAFVTKFSATGTSLVYSTYLGGAGTDQALGLALLNGQAFIAGATDSINFPTSAPYQSALHGGQDAFLAKLSTTGNQLLYSTYFGGSGGAPGTPEWASAVAVNGQGEAYITGVTSSSDFPTASPLQSTLHGATDAFVAKFNATGSALVFSTYLGGASTDQANAIMLNTSTGNVYVAGTTYSWDFPTNLPTQVSNAGLQDAFLSVLSPAGDFLLFSTYWGGSGSEEALAMTLTSTGNPVFVGRTYSSDFPLR